MPDPAAASAFIADQLAAIADYRRTEQMVRSCMAGPDALDDARARLARYGDPAVILREVRPPIPPVDCGEQ